jgi:hemerythrin-like domain-containing protein
MLNLKELSKTDPVKRNVEKGLEVAEHTPLDPPDAYTKGTLSKIGYNELHGALRGLVDENKLIAAQVDAFEKALVEFRDKGYTLSPVINKTFADFFRFFDETVSLHNHKEEKALFPVLQERLLEAGEHSIGEVPLTAVDVMEDDHVRFIQLAALSFNLFGLATRIADQKSAIFVYETAYNNARELIELMRLHIFREDHTLYPLAQKLLAADDLAGAEKRIKKSGHA